MKKLLKEKKAAGSESDQQIATLKEQVSTLQKELDEKERQINELLITDNLTKLYNREYLATVMVEEIARCQRYAHPLAVIMIDIDGFNSFNADHGIMVGDKMLSFAANLIKDNIRKFDRAFRYGGEEFVVVLPETDMTLAYIVAERIRSNFESVCRKEFAPGQYTVSAGITSVFAYTSNTIDMEELIDQADKALIRAKAKGGNMSIRFE